MTEVPSLSILVAHSDTETMESLTRFVEQSHRLAGICKTTSDLREACLNQPPELVVAGIGFPDGDGLDAMIDIGRQVQIPSVIVTAKRSLALVEKAMKDHVMAYLLEPVTADELQAAIVVAWSRSQQLRELAGEIEGLRGSLQDRKLIERAKGMLMANRDLTEEQAFSEMRRKAQDSRKPLVEVAQRIINAQEASVREED